MSYSIFWVRLHEVELKILSSIEFFNLLNEFVLSIIMWHNKVVVLVVAGMQSAQSFTGCCVCTHCWSAHKMYDGYRRFLARESRGRQRRVRYGGFVYEYAHIETRFVLTTNHLKNLISTLLIITFTTTHLQRQTYLSRHELCGQSNSLRRTASEILHGTQIKTFVVVVAWFRLAQAQCPWLDAWLENFGGDVT